MAYATQTKAGDELNRLYPEDAPIHEWYRFVLSFPPHLVRDYIEKFGLADGGRVLDPFCGTGTTLVECKKQGIQSVGIEANPVVQFAARTKTKWDVDPAKLVEHAEEIASAADQILRDHGLHVPTLFTPTVGGDGDSCSVELRSLDSGKENLLIGRSISPKPLHRVLVLLDEIERNRNREFYDHERLALAKQLVTSISNLRFGPEVGVGRPKEDAPVVNSWRRGVAAMADDLEALTDRTQVAAEVHLADSRALGRILPPASIDAVITSPPYPNEKDYSRTTRLESVLLGFTGSREDLRRQKHGLLRSNTRGVYRADEDDRWVDGIDRVQRLAERIEAKRLELGKTSGFERLYARVVKLYFGGMARHLEELKAVLRPGARLAYVVGDQASFFRIMIRTGEILAEVAESRGFAVDGIDLFRTRFSTATQSYLREEVVLLRWPG